MHSRKEKKHSLNLRRSLCLVQGLTFFLAGMGSSIAAPYVYFKASNGYYVSARNGGGVNALVKAQGSDQNSWERFDLRDLNGGILHDGDVVSFKSYGNSTGQYYLSAKGSGGGKLAADLTYEGSWERFTLIKLNGKGAISSGDKVAIRSSDGLHYVTVSNVDTIMDATSTTIGDAQTFVIEIGDRPQTFANPVNLPYTEVSNNSRDGADPQIIPFQGKYYLFSSCFQNMPFGYHISTDLVNWKFIEFGASTKTAILSKGTSPPAIDIVAPAAFTDGSYIYFARSSGMTAIRTNTPDSGDWQPYATDIFTKFDVSMLYDGGKVYNFSGGNASEVFECPLSTLKEISGTHQYLTPRILNPTDMANSPYGLHLGQNEYKQGTGPYRTDWTLPNALDTTRLLSVFDSYSTYAGLSTAEQTAWKNAGERSFNSAAEGTWVTKHPTNGKYYLENSCPGTYGQWYSEAVYTSTSPAGPYTLENYATSSLKVGGYINGVAHGGTFQDFSGNWWRICTMWAAKGRRIGLFPVGFDSQGRMFTKTSQGDYPTIRPRKFNDINTTSLHAGWQVISKGRTCTASTTETGRNLAAACDENIVTFWSARGDDPSPWFQMDLGSILTVQAIQMNFIDNFPTPANLSDDYHAYKLEGSTDGITWTVLSDKSANTTTFAHDYMAFSSPVQTRYLRIQSIHRAKGGRFALGDFRVFGNGTGSLPPQVTNFTATRRSSDTRHVTFNWTPTSNTQGYIINYGVASDALFLPIQYQNVSAGQLTVSCLNRDNPRYFYRIDSYNENGITKGTVISDPLPLAGAPLANNNFVPASGADQTQLLTYDDWAMEKYGTDHISPAAAFDQDANGDGVPNGIEYVLGTESPNLRTDFEPYSENSHRLVFEFYRKFLPDDVTIEVQASDNPAGPWEIAARAVGSGLFEEEHGFIVEQSGDDFRHVIVRDRVATQKENGSRRYMRLRVNQNQLLRY